VAKRPHWRFVLSSVVKERCDHYVAHTSDMRTYVSPPRSVPSRRGAPSRRAMLARREFKLRANHIDVNDQPVTDRQDG